MKKLIEITPQNIQHEHICCAFSDKKCAESYQQKKEWLKQMYPKGHRFIRLDERAKVFVEFGPADEAWVPIKAPSSLFIGCLWVSGKYKKSGYGKQLLGRAEQAAIDSNLDSLVTVAGKKKTPFLSDGKWLIRQGFQIAQETKSGFLLLWKALEDGAKPPVFSPQVLLNQHIQAGGLVAYYSHRCPFAEYHVLQSLKESAHKRGLPLKVVLIDSKEKAQSAPTPATIFSLFFDGKLLTTDISACMDSRLDKFLKLSAGFQEGRELDFLKRQ